jgi:hypothetical protein
MPAIVARSATGPTIAARLPPVRAVLALLAFVVGVLSAMAVGLGVVTAVLTGTVQDAPDLTCEACVEDAEPVGVVVARVAGVNRDRLDLDIDEVERGDVDGDVSVRSFGVALSPWSRYRLELFRDDTNGTYVTADAPPERVDGSMPAGLGAFSALTPSARWAIACLPALLASLWGLWVVTRVRAPA